MALSLIDEIKVFNDAYTKLERHTGTFSAYREELSKIANYQDSVLNQMIIAIAQDRHKGLEYTEGHISEFFSYLITNLYDMITSLNNEMPTFSGYLHSVLDRLEESEPEPEPEKTVDAVLLNALTKELVDSKTIEDLIKSINMYPIGEYNKADVYGSLMYAICNDGQTLSEESLEEYYVHLKQTWSELRSELEQKLFGNFNLYLKKLRKFIRLQAVRLEIMYDDKESGGVQSEVTAGYLFNDDKELKTIAATLKKSGTSLTAFAGVATRLVRSGVLSQINKNNLQQGGIAKNGKDPQLYAYKIKKYLKEFLEAYNMSTTSTTSTTHEFKKIARQKAMNNALMRLKSLFQLMIKDSHRNKSLKIRHKSITLKSLDEMKDHQESKNLVQNIENMIKKSQEKLKKKPKK